MCRSRSLDRGGPFVADQSAQWKRGLTVIYPDPLFFQPPLIGSWDSHLATSKYFPVFYIAYHAFAFLGDLIFLRYCIMPYDTMYLCYYCWNVYYHRAFALWFFPVLMLSIYLWGYFRPAYIRHSNVSILVRLRRYNMHKIYKLLKRTLSFPHTGTWISSMNKVYRTHYIIT